MQVRKICRWSMIGVAAIGASAAAGTAVGASDYPPGDTTPTTVIADLPTTTTPPVDTTAVGVMPPDAPVASTAPAAPTTTGVGAVLPTTGSDNDGVVKVAAGAAIAGVGLVAVSRRRRRHATPS
jgi:LPXTG-motif cell wall-anchored protein